VTLTEMVRDKTPARMRDFLAKPDIIVTNAKDKVTMLPVPPTSASDRCSIFLGGGVVTGDAKSRFRTRFAVSA